jgi:hypothetical protein
MTATTLPDETPMAKKKAKKLGRPAKPKGAAKSERYGFRARPEWIDWLNRFANFERSDMVDVIDRALEDRAKVKGFELPPKR